MKSLALLGALALAIPLAACNPPSPTAVSSVTTGVQAALAIANAIDPSLVAKADSALAALSGNSIAKACASVLPSVTFYQNVSFLVPAQQAAYANTVASAIASSCNGGLSSSASAVATLSKLWAGMQAAATVPK